jgi:hypothetical protein
MGEIMSSDDRFFERLREDAHPLRYQPEDDAVWTRLSAQIQAGIQEQPTVSQLLAAWFRPIAASFAAVVLVAAISVAWIERSPEPSGLDALASNSVEVAVGGDTFSVAE